MKAFKLNIAKYTICFFILFTACYCSYRYSSLVKVYENEEYSVWIKKWEHIYEKGESRVSQSKKKLFEQQAKDFLAKNMQELKSYIHNGNIEQSSQQVKYTRNMLLRIIVLENDFRNMEFEGIKIREFLEDAKNLACIKKASIYKDIDYKKWFNYWKLVEFSNNINSKLKLFNNQSKEVLYPIAQKLEAHRQLGNFDKIRLSIETLKKFRNNCIAINPDYGNLIEEDGELEYLRSNFIISVEREADILEASYFFEKKDYAKWLDAWLLIKPLKGNEEISGFSKQALTQLNSLVNNMHFSIDKGNCNNTSTIVLQIKKMFDKVLLILPDIENRYNKRFDFRYINLEYLNAACFAAKAQNYYSNEDYWSAVNTYKKINKMPNSLNNRYQEICSKIIQSLLKRYAKYLLLNELENELLCLSRIKEVYFLDTIQFGAFKLNNSLHKTNLWLAERKENLRQRIVFFIDNEIQKKSYTLAFDKLNELSSAFNHHKSINEYQTYMSFFRDVVAQNYLDTVKVLQKNNAFELSAQYIDSACYFNPQLQTETLKCKNQNLKGAHLLHRADSLLKANKFLLAKEQINKAIRLLTNSSSAIAVRKEIISKGTSFYKEKYKGNMVQENWNNCYCYCDSLNLLNNYNDESCKTKIIFEKTILEIEKQIQLNKYYEATLCISKINNLKLGAEEKNRFYVYKKEIAEKGVEYQMRKRDININSKNFEQALCNCDTISYIDSTLDVKTCKSKIRLEQHLSNSIALCNTMQYPQSVFEAEKALNLASNFNDKIRVQRHLDSIKIKAEIRIDILPIVNLDTQTFPINLEVFNAYLKKFIDKNNPSEFIVARPNNAIGSLLNEFNSYINAQSDISPFLNKYKNLYKTADYIVLMRILNYDFYSGWYDKKQKCACYEETKQNKVPVEKEGYEWKNVPVIDARTNRAVLKPVYRTNQFNYTYIERWDTLKELKKVKKNYIDYVYNDSYKYSKVNYNSHKGKVSGRLEIELLLFDIKELKRLSSKQYTITFTTKHFSKNEFSKNMQLDIRKLKTCPSESKLNLWMSEQTANLENSEINDFKKIDILFPSIKELFYKKIDPKLKKQLESNINEFLELLVDKNSLNQNSKYTFY